MSMSVKEEADFDYWAKMPRWDIHEASILCLGKDPNILTHDIYYYRLSPSLFAEYKRISNLVKRSKHTGCFDNSVYTILSDYILPYKFAEWANTNQVTFPEELAQKIIFYRQINSPKNDPLNDNTLPDYIPPYIEFMPKPQKH
jgi:hypothetical protein